MSAVREDDDFPPFADDVAGSCWASHRPQEVSRSGRRESAIRSVFDNAATQKSFDHSSMLAAQWRTQARNVDQELAVQVGDAESYETMEGLAPETLSETADAADGVGASGACPRCRRAREAASACEALLEASTLSAASAQGGGPEADWPDDAHELAEARLCFRERTSAWAEMEAWQAEQAERAERCADVSHSASELGATREELAVLEAHAQDLTAELLEERERRERDASEAAVQLEERRQSRDRLIEDHATQDEGLRLEMHSLRQELRDQLDASAEHVTELQVQLDASTAHATETSHQASELGALAEALEDRDARIEQAKVLAAGFEREICDLQDACRQASERSKGAPADEAALVEAAAIDAQRQDISRLTSELQYARAQVEEHEQDKIRIDELSLAVRQFPSVLESKEDEITTVASELTAARLQLEDAERRTEGSREAIETGSSELAACRAELLESEKQAKEVSSDLEATSLRLEDAERRALEHEAHAREPEGSGDASAELEHSDAARGAELAVQAQALVTSAADLADCRAELAQSAQQEAACVSELAAARLELEGVGQRACQLECSSEALTELERAATERAAECEARAAVCEAELAAARLELESVGQRACQLESSGEALSELERAATERAVECEARVASVASDLATCRAELAESERQVEARGSALTDVRLQLQALATSRADLENGKVELAESQEHAEEGASSDGGGASEKGSRSPRRGEASDEPPAEASEEPSAEEPEFAMFAELARLRRENSALSEENRDLKERASFFEDDLELVSGRHAHLLGHQNPKQKVRYTMRLKEERNQYRNEAEQLRAELSKVRTRVAELEGSKISTRQEARQIFDASASQASATSGRSRSRCATAPTTAPPTPTRNSPRTPRRPPAAAAAPGGGPSGAKKKAAEKPFEKAEEDESEESEGPEFTSPRKAACRAH